MLLVSATVECHSSVLLDLNPRIPLQVVVQILVLKYDFIFMDLFLKSCVCL